MPTKKQILQAQAEQLRLRLKNPIPKYVKYNGIRQTIEQNRNKITITYNDDRKTIIEVPNHLPITLEKWDQLLVNRNKVIHEVKFKK